jgi:hypothetical protein
MPGPFRRIPRRRIYASGKGGMQQLAGVPDFVPAIVIGARGKLTASALIARWFFSSLLPVSANGICLC